MRREPRGRRLRVGAALSIAIICSAGSAIADPRAEYDQAPPALLSAARLPASMTTLEPAVYDRRGTAAALLRSEPQRPRGLSGLYVGFIALQAADAHSTLTALRTGGAESNPMVRPFADRPALLITAKAAATIGTIALSERLWRKNRTAAVVLMVAANAAYAAVVAHNYRQARR